MWIKDMWHEVCASCWCVVGHGCKNSGPCNCDEENDAEESES